MQSVADKLLEKVNTKYELVGLGLVWGFIAGFAVFGFSSGIWSL